MSGPIGRLSRCHATRNLILALTAWWPEKVVEGQVAPRRPMTEAATITVEPGGRQTFAGFGTSLGNWSGDYQKLAAAERDRLAALLWRGLRMKSLRLWINLDEYAPETGKRLTADFRRRYIDSAIVADALRSGVVDLLLAPDAMPPGMKVKRAGGPQDFALRDESVSDYAALIAEFIAQIRAETGVLITATGLQNEPNDLDRITPEQIPPLVKALRRELDGRGLQAVRIIAPESANVDSTLFDAVDRLRADPTAWVALAGVASHSYGMAATPEAARRVESAAGSPAKEYWMTEASDNGPETPGDAVRAAALATRFLNDMNHRTTHWIHFLGFEVADPHDNATRIIAYSPDPLRLTIFQKYYYYRQLAEAFDVGAVFRRCQSSTEGAMTWTYGRKPRLTAAAALNPDGSWSIGLCNFTSPTFTDDANQPNSATNGQPARTITATVRVPELVAAGPLRFTLHRSGPYLTNAPEGDLTLTGGDLSVTLGPLELVTMRTAERVH